MKGYFVFLNNKFLIVKICENLKWWPRKPTYLDWCKRCYPILEYLFQVEHLKSYISLAHRCRAVSLFSRQTALFNQHCWSANTQYTVTDRILFIVFRNAGESLLLLVLHIWQCGNSFWRQVEKLWDGGVSDWNILISLTPQKYRMRFWRKSWIIWDGGGWLKY